MTEEDRRKQAAVLAEIAKLPPGTTIEEWNRQRITPDIIAQETKKLRARFIIPAKQKIH